jgi:hypothetical protein
MQVCDHIHQVYYRVTCIFMCMFRGLHVDDIMVHA